MAINQGSRLEMFFFRQRMINSFIVEKVCLDNRLL